MRPVPNREVEASDAIARVALRSLIRSCWERMDARRREDVYARFDAQIRLDERDDYVRDEAGRFASSGGSKAEGEGKGGKGDKGGKGPVSKLPDPFGHPPPSTDPDNYKPDPTHDHDHDGLTDAARVGVLGKEPPPLVTKVPRLANLKPHEREAEARFADAYEKDPQKFIDAYRAQVAASKSPNVFATDDAKMLSPDYAKDDAGKALYNIATHQTANAIAKAAFQQHVQEQFAKLPPEQRNILVTAGGCAAGKGYCLQNAPDQGVKDLQSHAAAIWDTAGEQNSTELPWVQKIAEDSGGRASYVFVDADPSKSFARVLSRAQGDPANGKKGEGRMVDDLLFAESYVIGAANFKSFAEKHADNPNASFVYLSARGSAPSISKTFPKEATAKTVAEVHANARAYIESRKGELSDHVYAGGTASNHLWAASKVASTAAGGS